MFHIYQFSIMRVSCSFRMREVSSTYMRRGRYGQVLMNLNELFSYIALVRIMKKILQET